MAKEYYIGFTKDGKERLFLKMYDYHEGTTYSYYKDLETRKIYGFGDVDETTLKPVNEILKGLKSNRKRKVKKAYKLDRSETIKLSTLVAGDIYEKTKINPITHEYERILIEKNVLFAKEKGGLITSISDKEYLLPFDHYWVQGRHAINIQNVSNYFKEDFVEELPKRKVLEIDYQRRKKEVK